jgi:hypothetical protein
VNTAVLPVYYLPNIHYFSRLFLFDDFLLDDREGFERQSYRNRCYIAGANGILPLIIPIQNRGTGQLTREVKIDNTNNWQRVHWQSIRSAYGKTPYFEYYADSLQTHFTGSCDSLFEYNVAMLKTLLKLAGMPKPHITPASEVQLSESHTRIAELIHPKKDYTLDSAFLPQRYMQPFEDRLGFIPNLSIIDALFNLGFGTRDYLRNCIPE